MQTSDLPVAPLWRRLAASLYDAFPAFALWMIAGALWIGIARALSTGARSGVEDMGHWAVGNPLYFIYLVAVAFAYYGVSWHRGGQTIGMRAWRVAIRTDHGIPLTWPCVMLRFTVAVIGVVAGGLGLWWMLIDRRGRMWHDIAAKTHVVLLPKRGA